jgi:hypothetical protein
MGGERMKPEMTITSPDIERAMAELTAKGWDRAALPPIRKAIRLSVNVTRKNVRSEARAHRRTGRMSGNVRTRMGGAGWRFTGAMRATGAPSNLIVGGVKPHPIDLGGKVMPIYGGRGAWKSGKGLAVEGFARRVEHPGFAPDPFVHRGIVRSGPAISGYLKDAAEEIARQLALRIRSK